MHPGKPCRREPPDRGCQHHDARLSENRTFIESDCDDCFKLYGVDLTGKKEYPRYPEGLPRELRKAPEDGPVPEPILAVGTTTVNVRLLGYRRGMAKEVAMYVNSLLNGQEEHTAAIDPESGMATLQFEQYGTAMAYVSCGPVFGMCWIAPGETLDMYVDMGAGGRAVVQRRDKEREPAPGRRLSMRWWMRAAAAVSA